MNHVGLTNVTRGHVLGTWIAVADRWWPRLRGLLGRSPLRPGAGLLLRPCRAVHTFGMSYPVDVAFVDQEGSVVAVYHRLAPGHCSRWHKGAECALEVPAGTLAMTGTREGDRLTWESCARSGTPSFSTPD
ncbi:MAG: DUF192 domain-containing protein [Gemmatimonadota bacterium]